MKATALVHAYVKLDRFVFFQLQNHPASPSHPDLIKQRLKENEGLADFEKLCEAGAEGDELLWLLAGCQGLSGFTRMLEVFGWSAPQLRKGLATIEKAASVIQKMQHRPFGLLARYADSISASGLDKNLRSYVALARAARSDFGHRSDWFLNIAKARLVIHVSHRTKQDPHDKEVSGLIAAVTATDYNADAQRRWRHRHKELVQDAWLDRYTIMGQGGREQVRQSWEQIAIQEPDFFKGFDRFTEDYKALAQTRGHSFANRHSAKTAR
jgi:hypothetical protein